MFIIMRSTASTGIYLDIAHPNKKGLIPIKIRVTYQRKTRYFKTGVFLSEEDYHKSYKAERPRGNYKVLKERLNDLLHRSQTITRDLYPFTFEKWKREYYKNNKNDDLASLFDQKINEQNELKKFGTAESYGHAKSKILEFLNDGRAKRHSICSLTPKQLYKFEEWMKDNGYSISTVAIYLRCLRHIFNRAISNKDIPQECYPFGAADTLYSIPESMNIKKALTIEEIKKIKEVDLSTDPYRQKARDFWLLSFLLNGINFNDLLRLQQHHFDGKEIVFTRKKTENTRKAPEPTIINVIPLAAELIKKYQGKGTYLFPNLDGIEKAEEKRRIIRNFNRKNCQHMKVLAKRLNINSTCSTNSCRHSFASLALNKGVAIEYISSCLSHGSVETTKRYLNGFNTDYRQELNNKVFEDL